MGRCRGASSPSPRKQRGSPGGLRLENPRTRCSRDSPVPRSMFRRRLSPRAMFARGKRGGGSGGGGKQINKQKRLRGFVGPPGIGSLVVFQVGLAGASGEGGGVRFPLGSAWPYSWNAPPPSKVLPPPPIFCPTWAAWVLSLRVHLISFPPRKAPRPRSSQRRGRWVV